MSDNFTVLKQRVSHSNYTSNRQAFCSKIVCCLQSQFRSFWSLMQGNFSQNISYFSLLLLVNETLVSYPNIC